MDESARVETRFDELRRRGGNVLLLDGGAGDRACRRLAGEDRRRVQVATGGRSWRGPIPAERDPDRLGVVEHVESLTRSAAADSTAAATPDDAAEWYTRVVDDGGLSRLAHAVHDHLARLSDITEESGELRLCVDGLGPLFEEYGAEDAARFCSVVAGRVHVERAIGHYHLPAGAADSVAEWAPFVFDATVETRVRDGVPQQRWRFFRPEQRTEWFRLERH